ncbi:MAG: S8 family peptidase [Usitatibacter sp.]
MPATSVPPEEQPRVDAFDPLVLDRTVIAVPLLKEIEKECKLIDDFKRLHPELLKEYNAAIEYNPYFDDGLHGAVELARKLADGAAEKAVKASERRVLAADEKLREFEQKRHADLLAAIRDQVIGPPLADSHHGPGRLHAAVIRRLMNASAALPESGETSEAPIRSIFPTRFEVILDLNLEYPRGREAARAWVFEHIEPAKLAAEVRDVGQDVHHEKDQINSQYVFARLEARAIRKLVEMDMAEAKAEAEKRRAATDNPALKAQIDAARYRAIFHIWPDFEVSACINKSIATVKADAAQNSFSAHGAGITWAVMDSGIRHDHEHFRKYANVDENCPWHRDFTVDGSGPFDDENGHGTHVAGIIAGEWHVPAEAGPDARRPVAVSRYLKTDTDDVEYQQTALEGMSGMAPRCKLVSLRVLDENGKGAVSNLIAAISHVQEINGYGRRILIHGVNMSLGYNFEPEWFACGQSPLCAEVDRLAKTGVVVVVAAGNTGYGSLKSAIGATTAGMALTINDPGNADLAITVGATHRDMPHVYGVSYFSSKGPTGDGRIKPDLVAPGEKIISCATGNLKKEGAHDLPCDYVETSGTSMAAPHVSGAIAAFLSVRMEFIGHSERVKEIFMTTATDLRRDRYFQGAGLVDLMRAIQSV